MIVHFRTLPTILCLIIISLTSSSAIYLRKDSTAEENRRDLLTLSKSWDPKTVTEKNAPIINKSDDANNVPPAFDSGLHIVFASFQSKVSNKHVNFNLVRAVIEENTKRMSAKFTVHAITNGVAAFEALSSIKGLMVVEVRDHAHERLRRFKESYVPQSNADVEYEAFCMWRWIVIADYFNRLAQLGVPINHIVSLDTDVILLEDPFFVDKGMDWSIVESYRIINGAAIIWSHQGLNSFANFLVDSYSSRKKAINLILQYGTTSRCNNERSQLIPCFYDDADKTNYVMTHMSDIQWYFAWTSKVHGTRFVKPVIDNHEQGIKGMDCYVTGSLSDRPIHFVKKEDGIYENSNIQTKKFCVLHFQGSSIRFVTPFLSFLYSDARGYLMEVDKD